MFTTDDVYVQRIYISGFVDDVTRFHATGSVYS